MFDHTQLLMVYVATLRELDLRNYDKNYEFKFNKTEIKHFTSQKFMSWFIMIHL